MQFDRLLTICAAGSRKATHWPAQRLYWSQLVERLATPIRSTETLAAYLGFPKARQDDLKDVGGYVAGELAGGRRKPSSVVGRDVVTLDLDQIPSGGTADVLRRIEALGCGYAVYSTRKHEEVRPRLRVLFPLFRTVSADEYEPLARKLASYLGMELCDPTTFQVSRLMYWPSCSSDAQYVYHAADRGFVDPDGVLGQYVNWRNVSEWPEVPGAAQTHVRLASKQGDPTQKSGIVGAFCRIYDVPHAIATFLSETYIEAEDGRFTFSGGSTAGGAVLYDSGAFLYSHHATDPAGGRLVNAFDLVRLHRFGHLDDEAKPETPVNKLPSFAAMSECAVADPKVRATLQEARHSSASEDFSDVLADDPDWMAKMTVHAQTGAPLKTIRNILTILENDPRIKKRIAFDEFSNRVLVLAPLPWNPREGRRIWSDQDDQGLRDYIEAEYGLSSRDKIDDALGLCAHRHTINDVQEYLKNLSWDGMPRLDTLLTDYLGAIDSAYTRGVSRKSLVAAVTRAMVPGCKYDTMPILSGPQGLGKSTFLAKLGQTWYSDSLTSFDGKDAYELIQGVWIIELGELAGMNRTETNTVKQFLSKQEDIFRESYGRRTNKYPRRCVFFGTSNESEFLRDQTGGRRFWPVDVGVQRPTKSVFRDLDAEVPQIWAEALYRWQIGEPLVFLGDEASLATEQQESHREVDTREGMIREFIARKVPSDWESRDIGARRLFWAAEFPTTDTKALVERDRICAIEIQVECLGQEVKSVRQAESRSINLMLKNTRGWREHRARCGPYGQQRCFVPKTLKMNELWQCDTCDTSSDSCVDS